MNLPLSVEKTFELDLLQELKEHAQVLVIPEGTVIMNLGQVIKVMPIVLTGTVKISRLSELGSELLMYYVNPMESCAMTLTSCMQQKPSEVEAVTESEVDLLAIPVEFMTKWMNRYPSWREFVMQTIQSRFEEMLNTIDQLAFQKLDSRLEYYLKEKSRITNSSLINLSHEQIAQELATSRVVISRLLKKLENNKKVRLYRSQIKLLRIM